MSGSLMAALILLVLMLCGMVVLIFTRKLFTSKLKLKYLVNSLVGLVFSVMCLFGIFGCIILVSTASHYLESTQIFSTGFTLVKISLLAVAVIGGAAIAYLYWNTPRRFLKYSEAEKSLITENDLEFKASIGKIPLVGKHLEKKVRVEKF